MLTAPPPLRPTGAVLLAKHARDFAVADQPGPLGVRNAALGTVRTVGPSEVLLVDLRSGSVISRLPPSGSYPESPATAVASGDAMAVAEGTDLEEGGGDAPADEGGNDAMSDAVGSEPESDRASASSVAATRPLVTPPHSRRHTAAVPLLSAATEAAMLSVSYMRYDEGTGVLVTGSQRGVVHLWQC